MALDRAKEYLKKYKLDNRIMLFDVSSATVREAAIALGCKEQNIAKTLSFLIGEDPILIVVAGDAKIDNSKYKKEFGLKAKMIPGDRVEELIGHAVGGVCPFGVNENVKIYLDESLKRFDIVYPAAGTGNSAVKLKLEELESIVNYEKWVDVCKEVCDE
ncbi:MAG: YbaK/EbsC family protein [Candidatus Coprovivens sp.]